MPLNLALAKPHTPASSAHQHLDQVPVHCPACGGSSLIDHLNVSNANFIPGWSTLQLKLCETCQLVFLDPMPTDRALHELYCSQHAFSTPFANPNAHRFAFHLFEQLYDRLGRYESFIVRQCLRRLGLRRRCAALDIGCGTGRLVQEFLRAQPTIDITGIDIDPNARAATSVTVRERIQICDWRSFSPERTFDLITLCFILEHVPDPNQLIRRTKSWLAPGGLLMISTPDLDSPKARQLGANWRLINDPRQKLGHVMWFTRSSLTALLRAHDLDVLTIRNRGESLYHCPHLVQRLFLKCLGTFDAPSGTRFIRNYYLRMLHAALIDGWLSEQFGCGDSMYAFAQRPR